MMPVLSSSTEAIVDLAQSMTSMSNAFSNLVSVAAYILLSLGLHTIAKRRGIHKPWLAWIPVGNLWILGCISDQYRHVVLQQEKKKRKTMLILGLISAVLTIVLVVTFAVAAINVIDRAPSVTVTKEQLAEIESLQGDAYAEELLKLMIESLTSEPEMLDYVFEQALTVGIVGMLLGAVSIALAVVQYTAYYDLFASCDPANKVLFVVLGVLFSTALSVFVFLCRKKDLGMPARGNSYIVEQAQ